jgi:hypothetical protein
VAFGSDGRLGLRQDLLLLGDLCLKLARVRQCQAALALLVTEARGGGGGENACPNDARFGTALCEGGGYKGGFEGVTGMALAGRFSIDVALKLGQARLRSCGRRFGLRAAAA